MKTVGLFAYGETAVSALKSLKSMFKVLWIITPSQNTRNATYVGLAVELLAKKSGIKIIKTNTKKDIMEIIAKNIPDAVVISSYNKILGSDILKFTKFINIHHGDLPRFRGRANINWALINDRKEIGLAFHETISDLDAGNVYAQYIVPITDIDTAKTIYDKFKDLIEQHTARIVEKVIKGFKGKKQKGKPTYCCTRLPEDGYIQWDKTSREIYNLVRALTHPYPGAFTYFDKKKLYVWNCEIPPNPKRYEGRIPGRIIKIHKGHGVEVLTKDSSIIIKEVTYNGKNINASSLITSVKTSLGINIVQLFEQVQDFVNGNSL